MTDTLLTELPFPLAGRVFRSPMPFGHYDEGGQVFALYRQNGVQAVVVLAEAAEILEKTGRNLLGFYAAQGLGVYHQPIRDFSVPSQADLERAVAAALGEAQAGRNVAIHCNAGIGRTGLVLACLARRVFGWQAEQAIRWVRQYIPTAVETDEQREAVQAFDPDNIP